MLSEQTFIANGGGVDLQANINPSVRDRRGSYSYYSIVSSLILNNIYYYYQSILGCKLKTDKNRPKTGKQLYYLSLEKFELMKIQTLEGFNDKL